MNDEYEIYKNNGVKLENTDIGFNENSYIVEINHKIVGYFNIHYFGDDVSFDYELLKEFHNQGIGNQFFKTIENWIIQNLEFKRILLLIRYDNEKSKNIVNQNNYFIDYNELEKIETYGEMTMYLPFVKEKAKIKKLA